jgi:hypothetical protein
VEARAHAAHSTSRARSSPALLPAGDTRTIQKSVDYKIRSSLGFRFVLAGRQNVSDLAHPALNPPLPVRAAKKLAPVHGPSVIQLTEKPRAEAPGVIVDSDLEIESERAASGAGRLPVGDPAGVSVRRTFIPEGLELCHRSYDRFLKVTLSLSSASTVPVS